MPDGTMEMSERVEERGGVVEGQLVMPFYIVCDVSGSMTPDMPALNAALQGFQDAIAHEPAVDDVARVGVLTFSDSASVVLPLDQLSERRMPTLSPQGGTNYSAAFTALRRAIADDRQRLKNEGYKIYRPCAFFLTDGAPTDRAWAQTFKDELTYDKTSARGNPSYPIFVPFGFRDAPEPVMKQLAYPPEKGRWYLERTSSVSAALEGVLHVIMNTVITSSRNAGARGALEIAPPPEGSTLASGASEHDEEFI